MSSGEIGLFGFPPDSPGKKQKKRWDESGERERAGCDRCRTTLWMSQRERDEVRTHGEREKAGEFIYPRCLMPAVRLCNYNPLSLAFSLSFPDSPLPRSFLYPSLCPLPADLCQPPWNHCHIRAFNRHGLASCSIQTYYSLLAHAHLSVFIHFMHSQLQPFSVY